MRETSSCRLLFSPGLYQHTFLWIALLFFQSFLRVGSSVVLPLVLHLYTVWKVKNSYQYYKWLHSFARGSSVSPYFALLWWRKKQVVALSFSCHLLVTLRWDGTHSKMYSSFFTWGVQQFLVTSKLPSLGIWVSMSQKWVRQQGDCPRCSVGRSSCFGHSGLMFAWKSDSKMLPKLGNWGSRDDLPSPSQSMLRAWVFLRASLLRVTGINADSSFWKTSWTIFTDS